MAGTPMIFLTGMPAAGKTYWGQQIATEYNMGFIDLDDYVVMEEKASVRALFAQYGEQGFRSLENKYLKQIIKQCETPTIVACGGGTPCFLDNITLMKEAGIIIYLDVEVDVLLAHLAVSDVIRPMLSNRGDLSVYLKDLLVKRQGFYDQAHYILHTKDISLTTFGKIINHV
jgi:shikimate kinase